MEELFNSTKHEVAENPIISKDTTTCRKCGNELISVGIQKIMAPPLDIMFCQTCDLQYWRKTVEEKE